MMGSNAIDPRHCLPSGDPWIQRPFVGDSPAGIVHSRGGAFEAQSSLQADAPSFLLFSEQLQPCNLGNPFATSFSYFQHDMRDISCARIVQALCAYYMYHAFGWNCQVGLVADIGQKYVN